MDERPLDEDPIEAWRKQKKIVTAQWVGDVVDEDYPQPVPTDDPFAVEARVQHPWEEEDEPEWYKKLYETPEYKPGDMVHIRVGECPIHGDMKTITAVEFFTVINGQRATVQKLEPGDEQRRPYKLGHTVRVKLVTPVAVKHAQLGSMLYASGLFMPHELVPVPESTEESEDS